jgi:Domain of unknown function (DUF4265)
MTKNLADKGYVKVRMTDLEGVHTETVWAVTVSPGRFRVDNVPWFAYGVSVGDIVEGAQYADGMYDFTRVTEASGNRTIRMILPDGESSDSARGKAILAEVRAIGCSFEGANGRYFGVTIPPGVGLPEVADVMVRTGVTWEYANPTWDDLFGPGSSSDTQQR